MDLLKGRVVIVSGIGPGVGKEVAYACAREGADVVLAARTASALEEVALGIQKRRQKALCVPTDIAKPEDCQRLVETAIKQFKRVDVLVNNAFLTHPWGAIESANFDDWKKILDVNLFGSLRLAQLVIPQMRRQGGGSIVMVNTMSMRIIEPNAGGYASSKAALMTATQTLAKEVGPTASASTRRPRLHLERQDGGLLPETSRRSSGVPRGSTRRSREQDGAPSHPRLRADRHAVLFFASDRRGLHRRRST
jgi:NAD(P)-dependent dehydrogenase (short-subunit alcohol dehydrogenase family)